MKKRGILLILIVLILLLCAINVNQRNIISKLEEEHEMITQENLKFEINEIHSNNERILLSHHVKFSKEDSQYQRYNVRLYFILDIPEDKFVGYIDSSNNSSLDDILYSINGNKVNYEISSIIMKDVNLEYIESRDVVSKLYEDKKEVLEDYFFNQGIKMENLIIKIEYHL